ncbi:hypothetical protein EHE21_09650 [Proteus sp. GOKU]|uniref:hypothetical protein n=1 Tax=Proteus TaxID=583 RepID=UPI001892ABBD|nr:MULTISPECIES: hypothetical protein [Proteus]QPB79630.1 hypothetical protein EHE21_09650 [Proteus sp. GOKU]QQP25637.1 hypothetical protein D7029_09650 [Proteus vulgaris]
MKNETKSEFLKFFLNLIIIVIGTLIFGVLLEKFKNDESFRTTLIKDYYSPLKVKELECNYKSNEYSKAYFGIGNYYSELQSRYIANKKGTGPSLTIEYQKYLIDTLKSAMDLSKKAEKIGYELRSCRGELRQLHVELSLVTGSYHEVVDSYNKKQSEIQKEQDRLKIESDKFTEMSKDKLQDKILNNFFKVGDPSRSVNEDDNKFLDNFIEKDMPSLIPVFHKVAEIEIEVSNIEKKYNKIIDEKIELEINERFRRGLLSRIGL